MKLKQYGFWTLHDADDNFGYWEVYDSLAEAVTEAPLKTDIYELNAKKLGMYCVRIKKSVVKAKEPKNVKN